MNPLLEKAGLKAKLALAKYGADATITRTVEAAQTLAERAAGRAPVASIVTTFGKAVLGPREVKADDGTSRQVLSATVDTPIVDGDTLTVGVRSYAVVGVEEVNPTGEAVALVYMATLE